MDTDKKTLVNIRHRSIYMYLYLYLYCTLYFVPEILTHVQQSTFEVQKGTKDQVFQNDLKFPGVKNCVSRQTEHGFFDFLKTPFDIDILVELKFFWIFNFLPCLPLNWFSGRQKARKNVYFYTSKSDFIS